MSFSNLLYLTRCRLLFDFLGLSLTLGMVVSDCVRRRIDIEFVLIDGHFIFVTKDSGNFF